MKKALFAAAVCVLSISCFAAGRATVTVSTDANWWDEMSESERTSSVQGVINAYERGWEVGTISEDQRFIAEFRAKSSTLGNTAMSIAFRKDGSGYASDRAYPLFSKSIGSYVEDISEFYKRHPNAESVRIGDVMSCLSDKSIYTCDLQKAQDTNPDTKKRRA